jgi:hypothetical protein
MMKKENLISEIIEIEMKMFLSVPNLEKTPCQRYPTRFQLHRRAQFLPWSEDTLESYLGDLKKAVRHGENLMTQKYARMDNLIPQINKNPLINKIVEIQCKWQEEVITNYPNMMSGARPLSNCQDSTNVTSFETYLGGELETYSDKTIGLLYKDICDKIRKKINMAEEVYTILVKEQGYGSIRKAERAIGMGEETHIDKQEIV